MDNDQIQATQTTDQVQAGEQDGNNQNSIPTSQDSTPVEKSIIDEIAEGAGFSPDDEYIKQLKAREESVKEPEAKLKAEKIKVGDKEYTREELVALPEDEFNKALETLKQAKTEQQPKFRDKEVITKDFDTIQQDKLKDFAGLFTRYINNSNPPVVEVKDEQGNIKQVPDYEVVKRAAIEAFQKGDIKGFAKYLTPEAAIDFNKEISEVGIKYQDKEKAILDEFGLYQQSQNEVIWDGYIKESAKDEQESFILNKFKKLYPNNFVKEEMENIIKIFRAAKAVEINKKVLKEQTEEIKQAMMGSNTSNPTIPTQPVFKTGDISKMPADEFLELEKQGVFDKYL